MTLTDILLPALILFAAYSVFGLTGFGAAMVGMPVMAALLPLTIVGLHKVGGYDYTYALVDADNIYLWPLRDRRDNNAWPYYYDPFWGPWGPYWGGGFWTPPVLIVRPPPPKH